MNDQAVDETLMLLRAHAEAMSFVAGALAGVLVEHGLMTASGFASLLRGAEGNQLTRAALNGIANGVEIGTSSKASKRPVNLRLVEGHLGEH